MQFTIQKATKRQLKARIGMIGPSGSGKTYSALALAAGLGEKICVIDTENGSASRYADEFTFDVLELSHHAPATYVQAIQAVEAAGYDVIIVDSLSHAWMGRDGALEQVDKAAKRSQSGNTFAAWRDVTPQHNALVEALTRCKAHLIVTIRAKTEYVMEQDSRGKTTPRKVGLAPIQRDGLEYEFDIVGDINLEHEWVVTKTRCRDLDGAIIAKPDAATAKRIRAWLSDGAPTPQPEQAGYQPQAAQKPARAEKAERTVEDVRAGFFTTWGQYFEPEGSIDFAYVRRVLNLDAQTPEPTTKRGWVELHNMLTEHAAWLEQTAAAAIEAEVAG